MKAGGTLFGFICLANGFSSFTGFILFTYCKFISDEAFFFIAGGLSGISLIILHTVFDMDALGLNKLDKDQCHEDEEMDDPDIIANLMLAADNR